MSAQGSFPKWLKLVYDQCPRAVPRGLQLEEIAIEDAQTRVTAEDVYAIDDVPRWPIAAHGGYALRTCDATRPRPGSPAVLAPLLDHGLQLALSKAMLLRASDFLLRGREGRLPGTILRDDLERS